jgi:hypothetical protein
MGFLIFVLLWSWSHEPDHEYEILIRIVIDFFYINFFISSFNVGFIKDSTSLFFFMIHFMWRYIVQPHNLCRGFVMLTWIDSGFLYYFILFDFHIKFSH